MNSRRAPLTAVRSSTTRSQGLRSLVIGAKKYYDSWPETIRNFVFFRIVVKHLVFLQFLRLLWKRHGLCQSISSMCSQRPGLPSNFNPVRSLSLFLLESVRGQARPSHQSKRDFLGLCRFRIPASLNSNIQWVKYTARGLGNKQNFINPIYFRCGGLDLAPSLARYPEGPENQIESKLAIEVEFFRHAKADQWR